MHAKRARVTDPQLDMVETAQLQKAKEHYDSAIIRVQEQQAAIDREREELKQKLEASKAADARREEEFEQRMAKERKDLEIKITLELQAKATEAYEKWLQEEETNVAEAKAKVTQRAESLEAWEAELTKRTAEVEAASQAISKDRQALEEETKRLAEQKDVIGRTQAAIHEEQLRQKKRGEDLMAWDTELRRQSFGGVRPSTSSPQQAPEAQSNGGQAFSGLPSRDRLIQAIQAADAKKKQNAIASQAAQPVEKAKAMCEFYGVQNHTQDRRSVKQEYIGQQTASTENEMVDTKTSQANKLTNLKLNLSLDDVIARRKEMGEDGDPKYGSRGGNRGSRVGNRGRGHKKR
ncbi:hypothetical protein P154DRAFT_523969 [Amniculicola lignicola CBS 123094]|uniref:Uncharacterized protein n=1 Tax=Amniculicola lignicola CBS 123094 TaxID=1392246 RepID=A0A6A5W976_9PLEO|nr:hypothetical protein P154DRAFT_523969 [Amniculicola lignicola CBS 123094]